MEHSVIVNAESVICTDGQAISLGDLRDVSAPRFLIGVDPSLGSGEVSTGELSRVAVVLKYQYPGVKGPPLVKLVSVASFAEADEIVTRIQAARKLARQVGGAAKAVVGRCESCGRELRVKASAIRPSMNLTCKCGSVNRVNAPAA